MNHKKLFQYSKNLNVLYIEDDIFVRDEVTSILETLFLSTTVCVDGDDGLNKYLSYYEKTNEFYDLIITDINMPKKNGIDMIKDMINLHEEQVIVVLSAYDESEKLIQLIQLGISNFALKPMDNDQLISSLYKSCKNIYNQKQNIHLEIEQNLLKYKKIAQREKMDAISKTLDNIAHQWRQPLSAICVSASGIKFQKERGVLSSNSENQMLESIINSTEYLSSIIDNFRRSNERKLEKEFFSISYILNKSIELISDKILKEDIEVIQNIEEFDIYNSVDEMIQIFVNILKNSIDILKIINEGKKYIFIDVYRQNNKCKISIKDNGGGIPKEIISKIYEPYFTTKYNSRGIGLGLHTTYHIVKNKLDADIEILNAQYDYGSKSYMGANSIITMNVE